MRSNIDLKWTLDLLDHVKHWFISQPLKYLNINKYPTYIIHSFLIRFNGNIKLKNWESLSIFRAQPWNHLKVLSLRTFWHEVANIDDLIEVDDDLRILRSMRFCIVTSFSWHYEILIDVNLKMCQTKSI